MPHLEDQLLNFPLPLSLELYPEVTVSKDVPGFVSNALLMPFINEVTLYLTHALYYTEHDNLFSTSQAILCLEKVKIAQY